MAKKPKPEAAAKGPSTPPVPPRLKERYEKELVPALAKQLGRDNPMSLPRLKKIVLNMDNITFIDSAGLGTLVSAHHSAKAQGSSMRLCHLGTKFTEVLQITKLMTIFDVYNTEAEAVASFSI